MEESILRCFFNKIHSICIDAVKLPCKSHSNNDLFVCFKCLQKRVDYTGTLLCLNCNREHRFNLNCVQNDTNEYKMLVNNNAEQIANSIRNQADLFNTNMKSTVIDDNDPLNSLNSLIEHIEFEIDVRVESLKNEMQLIRYKLFQNIDSYKNEKIKEALNDQLEFENIFQTSATIQQCEKDCLRLSNKANNIDHSLKIIEKSNEKQIKNPNLGRHSMIGYLNSTYSHFNSKIIKDLLKSTKFNIEFIDLNVRSICGLTEIYFFKSYKKNFELVITDFAANEIKYLSKFDSYLAKDIEIVNLNRLNGLKFKNYYSICNNSLDNNHNDYEQHSLFVCDMELHRVLIFDLKCTKLKKIIQGRTDTKVEFECPRDIFYFEQKIYVLDQGTNSVDIFTEEGVFIKSFHLNNNKDILVQNAWSVRVSSKLIAVVDWRLKVYLFDLDTNLIGSIEQPSISSMCLVDDSYYNLQLLFVHSENGDFIGYQLKEKNGELVTEIIYKQNFAKLRTASEFMIYSTSHKFLLSLGWSKQIAIVDIK